MSSGAEYAEPDENGMYSRWYVPACPLAHECSAKASTATDITTQHQITATHTTTKHTQQTHNETQNTTTQYTQQTHTRTNNEQQQAEAVHNQKQHTTNQRPQTITKPQSHTQKTQTTEQTQTTCFYKAWANQRKCASFISWDNCYAKLIHHITNSTLHQTEGRTYADIEKQCAEGSAAIDVELCDASWFMDHLHHGIVHSRILSGIFNSCVVMIFFSTYTMHP
jgi:hypothetical protein